MIVFLPKAWDVILNPVAGRISDRSQDPRGLRRPWLLRAGIGLAIAFSPIFAGLESGSRAAEAAWVLVFFLAAATAYAFFQVPSPPPGSDGRHQRAAGCGGAPDA